MNDHYLQSHPVHIGALSVIYAARSFIASGEITWLVIPYGGGVPMVTPARYPWKFICGGIRYKRPTDMDMLPS